MKEACWNTWAKMVERKRSLEMSKGRLENTIKMDLNDIKGYSQCI